MKINKADLVVSRGELYFDRLLPGKTIGEGEVYLGNTPGFAMSRRIQRRERTRSYYGRKYTQDLFPTGEELSASITTDNVAFDNVALWFSSEVTDYDQLGVGFIEETFIVRRERFYQLGKSVNNFGLSYVESVSASKQVGELSIPIALDENLDVRRTDGRFIIIDSAPDIIDGDTIKVRFENRSTTTRSLVKRQDEVVGSLRFVSFNVIGINKDYFFPRVRLTPSGELPMKGNQWQQLTWDVDILRISPRKEYVYIMQRGLGLYTLDEQGIVDSSGVFIEDFPYWEDQLDIVVNTDMADLGV